MLNPFLTSRHAGDGDGSIVATLAKVKQRLVVQPRPDALGVSQVALLPLLRACGVDVFDLGTLRGTTDGERMLYRIQLDGEWAVVTVHAVGFPLARGVGQDGTVDGAFSLRTNGGDWQLLTRGEDPYGFSLYDDVFPSVLARLFQVGGPDAARRLELARSLLQQEWLADKLARLSRDVGVEELRRLLGGGNVEPERVLELLRERRLIRDRQNIDERAVRRAVALTLKATELGLVREADTLATITLDDLLLHAEGVANLRGRLQATFDGVALPVTSRTALYLVLAGVAAQYGREDAIPAEDLVAPPARVPAGVRARPLGRPGWYLLLTRDSGSLAEATGALLDELGLRHRLRATQKGQPYPPPPGHHVADDAVGG
ncbi:MAG: hypothetical protein P8Y02_08800 [Deinococcales bacterium]